MKSLLNQVKDYILPQYPTFSSLFVIYGNDTQDDLVSFINRSVRSLKKKIKQSPLSPLTLSQFQISAMKEAEDLENIESDNDIIENSLNNEELMKKKTIVNELKDIDLFSFNINVTPIKSGGGESKDKIEYNINTNNSFGEEIPEEFPFPPITPPAPTSAKSTTSATSGNFINNSSSSNNTSPFDALFPLPPPTNPIEDLPPQQLQQPIDSNVIDYSPIKIRSKSVDDDEYDSSNNNRKVVNNSEMSNDSLPSLNMKSMSNDNGEEEEEGDNEENDDIDEIPLLTVEEIFQHDFFQNIIRVYNYFIIYIYYLFIVNNKLG